jgi:hypothetical protein
MFAQTHQKNRSFAAMLKWCRDRIKADRASDLTLCSETDVERMARDMCMSTAELRAAAKRGPDAAHLLQRRMADFDLDPSEVARTDPATSRDMQRICTLCKFHGRCALDFVRRSPRTAWARYCPNTSTLMELNTMPWASRREW